MTYSAEDLALSLPITRATRRTAQQFAAQQPTRQKAEQVRLNTLAVSVINDYLQMIGIPTDLAASDSWNPVVRLCADVADLEVTGVGRLECRPLRADEQTCSIPPEVWSDRIGYVIVQIDESFQRSTVLGFIQTAVDQLSLSQLRPIEDLIDHLEQRVRPLAVAPTSSSNLVNLRQWLQDIFEAGWQTVETLFNPAELAFSFRSADLATTDTSIQPNAGTRRAKLLELGTQLPVALVVELRPSEQRTDILLQVYPTGTQAYLPPNLQLIVLDESGAIFLEAQARSADNYMQLGFGGEPGERFSVKVALADVSTTEDFGL